MVSRRGLRIKFAEGEKVLCYEPDPAKTKVLYDSKVLNVEYRIDKYGKREPHYLIHFQGWSSTWDRLVTEDLILKDTTENRVLQKDLASQAQLIVRGGNLYRRERSSRQRSGGRSSTNGSTMSQGSDSDASDTEDTRPIILLPLPTIIKRALEYDEISITTQNKVLDLPAEPNIIAILESFLKDYAQKLMSHVCAKKQSSQMNKTSNLMTVEDYCRSMNLCREVVDGVRLFVDFSLPQILLYHQERGQYHEAKTKGIQRQIRIVPNIKIKIEEGEDCGPTSSKRALFDIPPATPAPDSGDRRRTLRSSHATAASTSVGSSSSSTPGPSQSNADMSTRHSLRRLSHDAKLSDQNGSVVVKIEGVNRVISQREHEVLDKILSWNLVPDKVKQKKPPLPSVLYGATHLVRALIRLPDLIQKADYSEARTSVVMDFLERILKYLEERVELFGEQHYVENTYPPPPVAVTETQANKQD